MNLLLNIIWLICGGFLICVEYIVSSLLLMITIVGIPFGFQTLKLSMLALCPFGREIRSCPGDGGCLSVLMNIIWTTCRWNLDQPLSSGIRGVALHHCHRHSIRTATFQAGGLGTYSFRKGDCIINIIPYGRLVTLDKMQRPTCVCHRLIPVLIFREEEQKDKREKIRSFVLE